MAYHFGWNIDYIVSLTPIQFSLIMDGLGEVLKQKYDPDYHSQEKKEIAAKISEIKAEGIKKKIVKKDKKDGKFKVNLSDLG